MVIAQSDLWSQKLWGAEITDMHPKPWGSDSVAVNFLARQPPPLNHIRLMTRLHFDEAAHVPEKSVEPSMSTWALNANTPHHSPTTPYDKEADGQSHLLPMVKVHGAIVHVDGQSCKQAQIEGNRILWARQLDTSSRNHDHAWEHGTLLMDNNLLFAHGTVGLGSEHDVVRTMAVATALEPVNYLLQVGTALFEDDAGAKRSTEPTFEHFWDMALAADMGNAGGAITAKMIFPDIDKVTHDKQYEDTKLWCGLEMYSDATVIIDRSDNTNTK
jgi:hypothetical protein